MKNRLLKIAALFLFALSPQLVGAAFSVDGISYVINDDGTTVSVSGNSSYSGEAIIPQSIVYQGNTYTVPPCNYLISTFAPDVRRIDIKSFILSFSYNNIPSRLYDINLV